MRSKNKTETSGCRCESIGWWCGEHDLSQREYQVDVRQTNAHDDPCGEGRGRANDVSLWKVHQELERAIVVYGVYHAV